MAFVCKKIRYQNLLSTGNVFTEIDLTCSKTTLIIGENGAGKSSILEALTFALYGKPFRNINKPQLLNTITGKGLLVELEMSANNKEYLIRRGMKPNIFEIYVNGELLNQDAGTRDYQEYFEKNIIKLNYKSFNQIVVLGSANYIPFMQLPPHQRRAVVEDLLDIQIFSVMNSLLKEKLQANKQDLNNIEYEIKLCKQKIELHEEHINNTKNSNQEIIASKQQKIEEYEQGIKNLEVEITKLEETLVDLQGQAGIYQENIAKRSKLLQIETSIKERMQKLNQDINFFHDYDNCPTCKQGIEHEFKQDTIDRKQNKLNELQAAIKKIDHDVNRLNEIIASLSEVNNSIHDINNKITENNRTITFNQRYIGELYNDIKQIQNSNRLLEDNNTNPNEYKKELKLFKEQRQKLLTDQELMSLAGHLLKDTGIKTKIIKQYIPIMNKLINKYLAALDFFVEFTLDEHFNETIKSRFRDDFTYASFSEGEKLRIDLALMFTWRAIAKLRNSASTNLLIMDEVFDSSLDASGTEEFLKILENQHENANIFVISHKGDQLFDRFERVLKFEKHSNFSRIAV